MNKYIEVDTAINCLEEWFWDSIWISGSKLTMIKQALRDVPAAEVVPIKRGYWKWTTMSHELYCSCCDKFSPAKIETNYCPNCGAEMISQRLYEKWSADE